MPQSFPQEWMPYLSAISDTSLRQKVALYVTNSQKLSRPDLVSKTPNPVSEHKSKFYAGSKVVSRGLVAHVVNVCELLLWACKKEPSLKQDVLLASALVHDIAHIYDELVSLLDHSFLGVCELYAQGFPLEVLHVVASHFGTSGPTPPMTREAVVFAMLDAVAANMEC